eukprot:TRINITY_DN1546_c0_g1_i1.p1 TRINITY_DN1546_c0_g1~~TRINITY_DN1546_c0_g1_i1.p1  ORF type:complete len:446 (+),score=103.17 TRINITY_DN1546_c0_g1_i1:203-1540(+)
MIRFNRILSSPIVYSHLRSTLTTTFKHTRLSPTHTIRSTNNFSALFIHTNKRLFSTQTNNQQNEENKENVNTQKNKEPEDFENPTFERKQKEDRKEKTTGQEGESAEGEENTSYFKAWARRFLKGDMGVIIPTVVTPAFLISLWLLLSSTYELDPQSTVYTLQEMFLESPRKYIVNAYDNVMGWFTPERRPLLPPALPTTYGRKYTIVIDMETLCDYTKKGGVWYLYKRAGVDFFLTSLFRQYEIVLYTKEPAGSNQAAIFKLDPTNFYFSTIKYREMVGMKESSTHQFTQDWEMLNRDPAKVIFIDHGYKHKYDHPNTIFIGKAQEGKADTVLIDLVPILKKYADENIDDFRPVVEELQCENPKEKIHEWRDMLAAGKPILLETPQRTHKDPDVKEKKKMNIIGTAVEALRSQDWSPKRPQPKQEELKDVAQQSLVDTTKSTKK